MRYLAILALTVVLAGMLAIGCDGGEASPSPTVAPTVAPVSTPTQAPTPTPSAVTEAWVARYQGRAGGAEWVYDITVDGSGNVYVTGKSFSDTPYDYSYATLKYDNDGNQLWLARYDGPGGDDDVAQAIAVDGYGNVYVTGKSYNSLHEDYAYATIKYDSDGNELWVARYDGAGVEDDDGRAIAIDGSGNVYVTGSSGGDYATIKYDSDGNQFWAARYEGSAGSDDGAVAVALDNSGNIYVAGTSQGDYATLKYDNDGDQLWAVRYYGSGGDDAARDMALDDAGNVYVTGKSYSCDWRHYEYATVKYDSGGNQVWAAGCHSEECGEGEPVCVAVDGSGNVYVTGRSYYNRKHLYGYATVKYDSNGNRCWVARYDGAAGGRESWPFDMALDGSGNIYVTGDSYNGSGVNYAYVTLKYNSDGNEVWVAYYNGPADGWDQAVALAVDALGNVYVTGKSDGGTSCRDFLTIKYVSQDSGL
jgi:hypothetical protein